MFAHGGKCDEALEHIVLLNPLMPTGIDRVDVVKSFSAVVESIGDTYHHHCPKQSSGECEWLSAWRSSVIHKKRKADQCFDVSFKPHMSCGTHSLILYGVRKEGRIEPLKSGYSSPPIIHSKRVVLT